MLMMISYNLLLPPKDNQTPCTSVSYLQTQYSLYAKLLCICHSSLTSNAIEQGIANNANITTHKVYTLDQKLITPFQRCCRELRPFSYMLGPSRVQNGSQGLGPPQTE